MKWLLGLTVILTAVFALAYLLTGAVGWLEPAWIEEQIAQLHSDRGGAILAAIALAGLLTFDLILPVPSSLLMTLAGTLFGFQLGWMISLTGAMGAALLGFAICRYWGRAAFDRLIGEREADRVDAFFERYGVWTILLSRSLPMLTEVVSCLAGLSALRFHRFLGLALAGTLPVCLLYAWAGSRALEPGALGWALLPAFLLPVAGFALVRGVRGWRRASARR